MERMIGLVAATAFAGLLFSGAAAAEDREDCFEACDTKMERCLNHCPEDKNGDPIRACRNSCAKKVFHPCLDACPDPRTGLSDEEKEKTEKLKQRQHR